MAPTPSPLPDRGHDIFRDPALNQTVQEDPLFRFIVKWWFQIVLVVGAIGFGLYARRVFHDTYVASMEHASQAFDQVREDFEQLTALQNQYRGIDAAPLKTGEKESDRAARRTEIEKQVADVRARLDAALSGLADMRAPYRDFAGVYRVLIARLEKGATAEQVAGVDKWRSIKDAASAERFAGEIEAIVIARGLLDDDATLQKGKEILSTLAREGNYVAVSAALSIAAIAVTVEEKEEAKIVLEELVARLPEQRPLIEPALGKLG